MEDPLNSLAPATPPTAPRALEHVLPTVWECAPLAMVVMDLQGRLVQANPAMCELTGYSHGELLALTWRDLTHPEDIEAKDRVIGRLLAGEQDSLDLDKRCLCRDRRTVHVRVRLSVLRDDADRTTGILGIAQDVSARIQAEAQLLRASQRDTLTGLANRHCFADELRRVMRAEPAVEAAVLFIDVDHFKTVNDSIGHHEGDNFLRLIAERIRGCLSQGQLLARYGGDEFTVLIAGFGALASARAIAACIHRRMQAPVGLGDRDLFCSASIGLVSTSTTGHDADTLMRDADIALYRAKERGRSCTVEFDASMGTAVQEWHDLRTDLHQATRRDELALHYQPIVALSSGATLGFEALMRWSHPRRGLIPPDAFLPIAEAHGLSPGLGQWTVATACHDLARLGSGSDAPYVSINMSMRQLADPGLVACVERNLAMWNVPATRLRVEVTEQVMAEDLGPVVRTLHALRAMGVGVYVDDFGTGVSSYAHLHRLPLDALKIDKAFVWGMVEQSEGLALVRSILGLSSSLGLSAIAEGVETEQQRDLLSAMGCELAQGWLFGRPEPLR